MGNTIIPLGKSGERCGVMLEFEDACPDKFAVLHRVRKQSATEGCPSLLIC
jgi:hypothetical protein